MMTSHRPLTTIEVSENVKNMHVYMSGVPWKGDFRTGKISDLPGREWSFAR